MNLDPDPDIVEIILQACKAGGLDSDAAHQIDHTIRAQYGGLRVRVPKRNKKEVKEQREKVISDGLTNMPTKDVVEKHGISRATLYRLMKQGR